MSRRTPAELDESLLNSRDIAKYSYLFFWTRPMHVPAWSIRVGEERDFFRDYFRADLFFSWL
jgi:hypothetical protein